MLTSNSFERRNRTRYSLELDALVLEVGEGKPVEHTCQVVNVSRYGVRFKAPTDFLPSGSAKIRLILPKLGPTTVLFRLITKTRAQCEVLYSVELLFNNEAERRKFHSFLASLGGAPQSDRRKGQRRVGGVSQVQVPERRRTDRRCDFGIFNKTRSFGRRVGGWSGAYTFFRRTEGMGPARIVVNGRSLIAYGSKDYLGLSHHPRVKEAAIKALELYGTGSGSRVLTGTFALHEELEHELAEFLGYETALVFSGGYLANIAILTGLLGKGDVVFFDEKVHASIIDGCIFSGAKVVPFRHNSIGDLDAKLNQTKGVSGLIVVDGVYSVEGDLANLPLIQQTADRYHIPLMVDDAHGFGVMGHAGRGTVAHFGLLGLVDLEMGTMSGAFGGFGGFLGGAKHVGDYLRHFSKAFLFTTSLPASATAAALEALRIMRLDNSRHLRLRANIERFRAGLEMAGYEISQSDSAIISIFFGHEHLAYNVAKMLEARDIYVNAFVRPAVKKGEASIRAAVTAAHSEADIDQTIEAFKNIKPIVDEQVEVYLRTK